jgi:hypothetical protein
VEAVIQKLLKVGVPSDRATLDRLPQFEPDVSFDIHDFDIESGTYRAFPTDRESQLIRILSECVAPYVRLTEWNGKPTNLDRYIEAARLAVAIYVYQRKKQSQYDRAKAKELLIKTHNDIFRAWKSLIALSQRRELMDYLENVYLATTNSSEPSEKRSAGALKRGLRKYKIRLESFSKIAPHVAAVNLGRLEPIIMLAAERVGYQAGDYQRDSIAQKFTDEMAFAWPTGTGKLPTYSKPSRRSRNQSPFAALLTAINKQFFDPELQSHNDFRDHAVKSVKLLKAKFRK